MIKTDIDTIEIELTQVCNLKCKYCFARKIAKAMSEDTFNNTLEFIINTAKTTTSDSFTVIITGGEAMTFDLDLLLAGIRKLKNNISLRLNIILQTNLTYTLTDKHIELFKELTELSTSWDYTIRFDNIKKEALFFKNLEEIKALNIPLHMIVIMSDLLIKNVTPEMFMSFLMATGIKGFDFNRLFVPRTTNEEEFTRTLAIKNKDIREWQYNVFKLYEKVKDILGLDVFNFEGARKAFTGFFHNEWSKTCPVYLVHITPFGKIVRCYDGNEKSFGDVNEKTFDFNKYQEILKEHSEYMALEECKTCKYFKYCHSGCPYMHVDDTGCSVPYKIYDYLTEKSLLENAAK